MICSTSWHLASLLQLSDGNASTALHLVIGNAMRCWARGRHKFSPCFKPTSYNNKQPRFFMRCSFGHIYGAVTTRVVNLGGRCAPTNAFRAATAVFSSSGMHWVSSVLAWRAFPPAGVLQNAKVLACVQGGPCNHGLDHMHIRCHYVRTHTRARLRSSQLSANPILPPYVICTAMRHAPG